MSWFATDYWIPSILLVVSVSAAPVCFWIGTPALVFCGCIWLIGIPLNLSSIKMTSKIRATRAKIERIKRETAALRLEARIGRRH